MRYPVWWQILLIVAVVSFIDATRVLKSSKKSKDDSRETQGGKKSRQPEIVCDPIDLTGSCSPSMELICTGSTGGARMADMTGYILRLARPSAKMIQLDGGTQIQGLELAAACGHFDELERIDAKSMDYVEKSQIAWQHIVGQIISHPHLDHIADFTIMSQELPFGGNFPVYARDRVLQDLHDHIFNFRIWPDFFTLGTLKKAPLEQFVPIRVDDIGMDLTAFPLTHESAGGSTAFLLQDPVTNSAFLAVFDTGPDSIYETKQLGDVWDHVAPLVRSGHLKAILMESSFVTAHDDSQLFGHLTPCYVLQELRALATAVGNAEHALEGLNILIMHIKWKVLDADYVDSVRSEFELEELNNGQGTCNEKNDFKVRFTFVEQGGRYLL